MDVKDIKDLILTIEKTSIEKVEIEKNDIKIMITKKVFNECSDTAKSRIENSQERNTVSRIDVNNEAIQTEAHREVTNKPEISNEDLYIVKSPIVGTFYGAPSPDAANFVKAGDIVEKGQTLCIIEAMKIMNEIECEVAGEVVEILVNDEDIVEYGQPLMSIRR